MILAAVTIFCLSGWAFATSWQRTAGIGTEVGGAIINVWKAFFILTLISLWFETQPSILLAMANPPAPAALDVCTYSPISSNCLLGEILLGWLTRLTPWLTPWALVSFTLLSLAAPISGWKSAIMKTFAQTATWFTGTIVPSFLWLLYLQLTYAGLVSPSARWVYWIAFAIALAAAQFIDPNATSLHRLYRLG